MSHPSRALGRSLLLATTLLAACASTDEEPALEPTPYSPPTPQEPESIGYFLAQYDLSLRSWVNLKLGGSSQQDRRRLRALERDLARRAVEREEELVDVLESGAPINRQVAAVALGFTGDPAMVSPLVAALSDPDPDLVQKALLGIGVLAQAETPLAQPAYLLINDPSPWTRNNAAFAIQCVVAEGGGSRELLVEPCRDALLDTEPGVRAQCASILGLLADADAIQPLGDLLYDEVYLVAAAAASSLAHISRIELNEKGRVARILVDALDRVEPRQRTHLLAELTLVADGNYGEESEAWKDWAYKLP